MHEKETTSETDGMAVVNVNVNGTEGEKGTIIMAEVMIDILAPATCPTTIENGVRSMTDQTGITTDGDGKVVHGGNHPPVQSERSHPHVACVRSISPTEFAIPDYPAI
jgi:hypothetical protein